MPGLDAKGATTTTNLPISATVAAKCLVSADAMDFGAYDPVGANAATALTTQGAITVTCVKNTNYSIALGPGLNYANGERNMSNGTGLLHYELYSDSGLATVWNDGSNGGSLLSGTAASLAPLSIPVYGQVFPGQDVAAGNYSDTVTVTVQF
jgi:spore coat protein U-like protein